MPEIKRKRIDNSEFYSCLVINKTKRAGFLTFFFILFMSLTISIIANTFNSGPWTYLLLPVFLFGIPIIFFPVVEYWEYKPWQARAQKYEQHYRD